MAWLNKRKYIFIEKNFSCKMQPIEQLWSVGYQCRVKRAWEVHFRRNYWGNIQKIRRIHSFHLRIIFARFNCIGYHDFYWTYSVTPPGLCHLHIQTYQNIYLYESSNYEHLSQTILDIRDAKWFIYFKCLSTLLSL